MCVIVACLQVILDVVVLNCDHGRDRVIYAALPVENPRHTGVVERQERRHHKWRGHRLQYDTDRDPGLPRENVLVLR